MNRFIKYIFWGFLSLTLTALFLILIVCTYVELQLPNVQSLKDVHLQVPLKVYSADNKLIAEFGSKRRIPVTLKEVPPLLIKAILATEDARYYEHSGVDLIGIIRATLAVIHSGRKVQGASTITMQVARNFYLSSEKTYSRKIEEILLALKIDRQLSKNKILELYLNRIYLGNHAYGVASAAQIYYGKKLSELTLDEMAVIAGLPQAPSRNNPLNNPAQALKRRNHVLSRMLELKFINQHDFDQATQQPLTASFHELKVEVQAPYIAEMVRNFMFTQYGDDAYEKGYSVYTTLHADLQAAANRALTQGLMAYDQRHGYRKSTLNLDAYDFNRWINALQKVPTFSEFLPAAITQCDANSAHALLATGEEITINWPGLAWASPEIAQGLAGPAPSTANQIVNHGDVVYVRQDAKSQWLLSQIPQAEGALVSLNPSNGAILALVGGFDYVLSNFNRATQATRQPGSNFKPFIYAAALEKGYTLASIFNDAPIVQADTGENALWRPTNDSHQFYGPTPLSVGLIESRNLVSIRILQALGIPYALNYIKNFGFNPDTLPHSLSLALGSGLVTPLQIANGYAIFANGGYQVSPFFIERIENENKQVIFQGHPPTACTACDAPNAGIQTVPYPAAPRVISPQIAFLMNHVMQNVIKEGTGKEALILKRNDLAGKTGTTNQKTDAWFSGFNANIVTTVWVGFDNLQPLQEYGNKAALPIWIQYMHFALNNMPENSMPEPSGIVTARIDPQTGLLAKPQQKDAKFELFRVNNVPQTFSNDKQESNSDNLGNNENGDTINQQLF